MPTPCSDEPLPRRGPDAHVRYNYLHPETDEPLEGGKVKIVLSSEGGRTEEFFIIPTKSKRGLLVSAADKGARKIWDGTRAVDL